MWVPYEKKKIFENKRNETDRGMLRKKKQTAEELYFYFSSILFFLRFMSFLPSKFVEINTKSALRDEGYAWVPETRDFTENSGKYSKNPNFLVFLRSMSF